MRRLSLALFTLCLLVPSAFGQSNTGTLRGTVVDPGGAAVAGATVTVTDNATGRERTLQTSGEGTFSLAQLEVGTYTVRVQGQGFKTFVATDVKIDIAREYALAATLTAGGVEETVTVVAGADVINSTSAELSNTVSTRQIQELPLNGRNPLSLISLQAGAVSNGATNTVINGQQSSFTNITRDGLNVQDNFIRSNATDFVPDRPNVDDVGEFTVTTQNAGAERGYGASQVELVTPRGTSEFHGAAFIYNRNSKFTANSFFNNRNGIERPFLNRNQFGGRLGGPLPLFNFGEGGPTFLRDKGFFFGSYEGFRLRQSSSATRTILLPGARQGLFPSRDNAGVVRTVNVLQLAGVGIDPVIASRVLANVPTAGNNTAVGDQLNTTGLSFNQKANQDRESVTGRIDILPSSRQAFEFIFGYRKELLLRPDIENASGFNPVPFGFQDAKTKSFVTAWRFSPTATLTNEVRGGFLFSDPAFDRTNQPTDFFLALPLISNPESPFQTQGRDTQQYTLQDNANYTRGNHNIRFGGQFQAFRINPFGPPAFSQSTIPTLTIGTNTSTPSLAAGLFPGGISTAQLGTANSLLALLGGFVSGANLTFNATSPTSGLQANTLPSRDLHFENYSLYVADSWRATPRLTLNFGLRYELFSPLREPNRLAVEPVIPAGTDPVQAVLNPNGQYNLVGTNAGGKNFFRFDKNNFAPVLSFAYSPNFKNNFLNSAFPGEGRTVIRGGYRISYVNDEFVRGADNALNGNQAFTQQVVQSNLNLRVAGGAPAFTVPTLNLPRTFAQNNALAGNFGTVFAIDPNLKVPMTQEYNLGIQREIGFNTAIEIRYVGGKSDNLIRGLDYNQVDIFNNGFLADFERARRNLARFNNPACTAANAAATGCEVLTIFPQLGNGGLLANATIRSLIAGGTPADLATTYITNSFAGASQLFLPNPNAGVADVLGNTAKYRYNSLQVEARRRFSQGFLFQANYTFQKTLTDTGGVGQTNFDPALDINNLDLEYMRALYDSTHVFNFYTIYELPFGRGKRFFNEGGLVNTLLGGWQINSIVQASSGAPITITDPRGTLNRAGRSGFQTANSNLSGDQLRDLFGVFRTPCGVFYINPSAININQAALNAGQCGSAQLGSGRGAEGFGTAAFPGQVFFNAAPGQTGSLPRSFVNGPVYVNWDASLIKNIPLDFIREGMRFQIRGEAFNVMNRANFFFGNTSSINSTNFGRITSTFSPRVVQFVGRLEF
jgi:hypothetical protein